MGNVLLLQPLKLILDTKISLSSAVDAKIKYKKPDKTTGTWDATISGQTIYKELTGSELDQNGRWLFHSYVLFSGKTYYTTGKLVWVYIYDPYEYQIL